MIPVTRFTPNGTKMQLLAGPPWPFSELLLEGVWSFQEHEIDPPAGHQCVPLKKKSS
jgi:hypothetical protein